MAKSNILLAAVNACYNHTNLAVRSISLYINKPEIVLFGEWTINQPVGEILRGISEFEPELVIFSTYIWNAEIVQKLISDLKKILPNVIIGAGGPEIGFAAEFYLKKFDSLDFVVFGEGEETTREIVEFYQKNKNDNPDFQKSFLENLKQVKGLFLRSGFTGERNLICNLDDLPFPYPVIDDPDNRIYYYESSRGCPFSCSYCMSSLDKRVRFTSLERTFSDIQKFLDAKVKLVKFVDRTYNLDENRYISIWEYILSHHNGKTMFHFEIEAEFLSEKALVFLQKVPCGVMQFEIGVQSSNQKTLKAVGRSPNVQKLKENIFRIPETIHSHLDLIAGLPFENLESFGHSFDFVMEMKPDALQLGFLKVLHGTKMEEYSSENGWLWMENPPYETLSTPYMSYGDLMFLKDVEKLVDAYWNSGSFKATMNYIFSKQSSWDWFVKMAGLCRQKGVFAQPRREQFWFEFLAGNCESDFEKELLRFDFVRSGKKGGFPDWYEHRYDKDEHRMALEANGGIENARIGFAFSEYEEFSINPLIWFNKTDCEDKEKTEIESGKFKILFVYPRRDHPEQVFKQILLEKD